MNLINYLSLLLFIIPTVEAREPADKPNIIFILIDDLGKEWLSCLVVKALRLPQLTL
ncbi:MAG: hypothetical protein ACI9SQ_000657 [Rubritalea sp.]|jgi:hypothetical protein